MATKILQGLGALLLVTALASPEALWFAQAERDRLEKLSGRVASSRASFRIAGNVKGLYPGRKKVLPIKVRNPNSFPIVVKQIQVRVKRSNQAGCGSRWIAGRTLRLSLRVPARRRAKTSTTLQLKRMAPGACRGARWRVTFSGGAVRKR